MTTAKECEQLVTIARNTVGTDELGIDWWSRSSRPVLNHRRDCSGRDLSPRMSRGEFARWMRGFIEGAEMAQQSWTAGNASREHCDHCASIKPCRVLPTSTDPMGSNVILCEECHIERELPWRVLRNETLSKSAQFDLPEWDSLKVYEVTE